MRHRSRSSEAGYSVVELALVVSIVGIMATLAIPSFLTYYQAATLRTAAEEVAAFINQGRQIGIRENVGVCVHITPTALHYHLGSCAEDPATKWKGPGTDTQGNIGLPAGITVTTSADPLFSYLGAATPAATYTVTNSRDGQRLRVSVAASGRVSIGP